MQKRHQDKIERTRRDNAVTKLQARARGRFARLETARQKRAATLIQARVRGSQVKAKIRDQIPPPPQLTEEEAIIKLQAVARSRMARTGSKLAEAKKRRRKKIERDEREEEYRIRANRFEKSIE